MKILHSWLTHFVDLKDYTPQQIAETLTMSGLEVEHIETKLRVPGNLSGVVVGKILECSQHPNADRLKVCQVDVGDPEPLSIVCGAPNAAANQFVFVAKIGTTLYPIDSEQITIKKSKIRGVESWGMICAEDELGLGTNHGGIIILKDSVKTGIPASQYLNLEPDYVYEIGLTPNRTDAMGHWGVARELAALIDRPFIPPAIKPRQASTISPTLQIEVIEKQAVPKYAGIIITGIKPSVTPDWVQRSLTAIGERCVNPIVDITNLVLFESGQPLHAFDLKKLSSQKITIRLAQHNEHFIGLGNKEFQLSEKDIVIADGQQIVCLAGILGGVTSAVDEQTQSIFLEAAYFDPSHIRKTARKLGIHSPAAFRFERGCDPDMIQYALQRAAELITEYFGGTATDILVIENQRIEPKRIVFSPEKASQLIGQHLTPETMFEILTKLGMVILSPVYQPEWIVEVPHFRHDVSRFQDVIEEILRFYGLNNIEPARKLNAAPVLALQNDYQFRFRVSDRLAGRGFNQIINNSLISRDLETDNSVSLINPLSEDLAILRTSLIYGVLETIAFNINRKAANLRLFEWGKTYAQVGYQFQENINLVLALTGNDSPTHWQQRPNAINLFSIKGEVEQLLSELGINFSWKPASLDQFQDCLLLLSQDKQFGKAGKVSPKILKPFDIEQDVYLAVIEWNKISSQIPALKVRFKEIPKFPSVRRDLSLVLTGNINFDEISTVIKQVNPKLIVDVSLFDKFKPADQPTCYGVSIEFYDSQKTLTDARVEQLMQQILSCLEETGKITLRK